MKCCGSRRWKGVHGLLGLCGLVLGGLAHALDTQSCQALSQQGGKFSLGLTACAAPAAAAATSAGPARTLPRAALAQQLHLFERAEPAAVAPVAAPSAPAAAPASRRRGTAPREVQRPAALTRALELAPAVERVAADHAIDPLLLHAIARVESRHDTRAVSPAGARGLMQVMPATGARFGVGHAAALHDAPTNLAVSARYLRVLHTRFGGQLPLVLAAYNAGEGAVERHGRRIPPYAETQGYVRQVLTEYARLQAASGWAAE